MESVLDNGSALLPFLYFQQRGYPGSQLHLSHSFEDSVESSVSFRSVVVVEVMVVVVVVVVIVVGLCSWNITVSIHCIVFRFVDGNSISPTVNLVGANGNSKRGYARTSVQ